MLSSSPSLLIPKGSLGENEEERELANPGLLEKQQLKLECGPNMMAALPNIGGTHEE